MSKEAAQVKMLPASEAGPGVRCRTGSGAEYLISQNIGTRKHTLWAVIHGGYRKILSAASPVDLYEKINWEDTAKETAI